MTWADVVRVTDELYEYAKDHDSETDMSDHDGFEWVEDEDGEDEENSDDENEMNSEQSWSDTLDELKEIMENGDLEAGITMFFMDRGIDSGDIIAQKKTKIQDCDNIIDLKKRIDSLAVELIAENINSSIKGTVKRIKQPIEGTYGCQRIPDDGKIGQRVQDIFSI